MSQSWCRPVPSYRGAALIGALVLTVSLLAGCGSASAHRLSATLGDPSQSTVVVGGHTPGALSVAVSRTLFSAAPVVVVADGHDHPAVAKAASRARTLGVPLLLDDGTGGAVADEIGRLGCQHVLAAGAHEKHALHADLGDSSDVQLVTDPRDLPSVAPPHHSPGTAVLVHAGGDADTRAGAAAVTATARAAGADVVPVHGTDPRTDPAAITALHKHQPEHVLAAGDDFGPVDRLSARVAVATTGRQLPGGGQVMFPGRRLVALYGHPGTPVLGVLGEQGLRDSITRARKVARPYRSRSDVPVVPTFEIIATTAQAAPGPDGDYSAESGVDELRPWVTAAGKAGMYVVLDLQPGRADLLDQAKLYASLLKLPYVGLALDPEWHLEKGQRPLAQIGSVDSSKINQVSAWLARLTARARLPQKLLVLHQFQLSMIGHEQKLDTSHDDLAMLVHMDGQGSPQLKDGTWGRITKAAPAGIHWWGWKDFYDEDHPMLTPAQTMSKRPTPVMISYQ